MTPAAASKTGRRSRRRRVAPTPPAQPTRPSNRALRAAAQREATAYALQRPPSLADRLSGPIVESPAAWRPIAALVICVLGLGVSVYLTVDHFGHFPLACSDSGLVNCAKVTTSAQSYFLHIPVAVLGLAFFVGMTALNLPVAWRVQDRRIHLVRLAGAVVGMCFVLYLISAELLIIKNICLWCTSVHFLTFLLFVLLLATIPPMMGWTASTVATAADDDTADDDTADDDTADDDTADDDTADDDTEGPAVTGAPAAMDETAATATAAMDEAERATATD